MPVRPRFEELEARMTPSAADLANFQQQFLPPLQAQLPVIVQTVQMTLQTNLLQLEALTPLFPAAYQPLFGALLLQEQQLFNSVPELTNLWFQQMVGNYEAQLLAQQLSSPFQSPDGFGGYPFGGFFPGGYLGYPGLFPATIGGPFLGGSNFTGANFTGSATTGSSATSPFSPNGHVMGTGLLSAVGALTLPPSNQLGSLGIV